jgi:predicted HTH transcriptional regulator
MVKCAHFHGTEVAKPIPSYQVYKGTVFELVDQAVDFVLSKINLAVGTRERSTQVPVAYEIPPEVVREAIVNAVAHRDYTSNGSVQVMLFADRLEVWNPGNLPPPLTLEKLREPHGSVPGNPLLAEPLYLAKYIERMGTGTGDMIRRCREAGLPEPVFSVSDGFVVTIRRKAVQVTGEVTGEVAEEVTGEVRKLLMVCHGAMTRKQVQEALSLKGEENFRKLYLVPALDDGLIEMTIPDKPKSRLQKYRLTAKGTAALSGVRKP